MLRVQCSPSAYGICRDGVPAGADASTYCRCRAGVSSFAYQGTNAHLTAAPPAAGTPHPGASTNEWPWRRARYWFQTSCHPLLHAGAALPDGGAAVQLVVAKPALRYLWDHCIQVGAAGSGIA